MNNGKYGEWYFKYKMEQRNNAVQDVRQNPQYQYQDIDFIITSASGDTKTFEVKFDDRIYTTGNLYLEIKNVHSKQWGGKGWWEFCRADFLAYGDGKKNLFYIIPMEKLRQRVAELPERMAQCKSDSVGKLVSLDAIKDIIVLEI